MSAPARTSLTPDEDAALTRIMICAMPPMLISPDDVAWLVAIIRRLDARLSNAMAVLTEWGNVDKTTAMAQRDALARALERIAATRRVENGKTIYSAPAHLNAVGIADAALARLDEKR